MKVHRFEGGGEVYLLFYCPGCKTPHQVRVSAGGWTWNGKMESPTLHPSILVDKSEPTRICHSWVKDGKIQFLNDCHHELKGQTVEIPEWNDWP